MRSYEEKVEDYFKNQLRELGIGYKTKTEPINKSVDNALTNYQSKSGGSGKNYPDIKLLLSSDYNRSVPVMIEVKGTPGALVKYVGENSTGIDRRRSAVQRFAVNGAIHYANAVLEGSDYEEVIAVGCNGYPDANGSLRTELKAYYLTNRKARIPLEIYDCEDLGFLRKENRENLLRQLDRLTLSEEELEQQKSRIENNLEAAIKSIHQAIYDDSAFKNALGDEQRLYLFCGLIMSCLPMKGAKDFDIANHTKTNDGEAVLDRIRDYLRNKTENATKNKTILNLLDPVFLKKELWREDLYNHEKESMIKILWKRIKREVIPFLGADLHLDFAGKILNSLNDWIKLDGDAKNDVVLTPRYVTSFMAKLARTDMNSYVWDCAMGSGGFLTSAMDIMLRNAETQYKNDPEGLERKKKDIKSKQILGIEILGNVYILACLNMFLMGDGSSNFIEGDTFKHEKFQENDFKDKFPATVFLLNPPYSPKGKGFEFVEFALARMFKGYACILIQENAGSGNGLHYPKEILKNNTLLASIHMPNDLFAGKSSVQTAVYLFEVNKPHDPRANVTFVDMSDDGYKRSNRKHSSQDVNLRDIDHAKERYQEVEDIILGRKPKTNYYTEANGLVIRDTISLKGNDWTFAQHRKIDTKPTFEDFKKTVKDFLSWKVSQIIQNEEVCLGKR